MTRWRAKRRFEANRRFADSADEALVAISILEAETEGIELDQPDEEVRSKLENGRVLLDKIRGALAEESDANPDELAIARQIREESLDPPSRLVSDFESMISTVERAKTDLTYSDELGEVRSWLKRLSETASRTSRDSINRMRGTLADGSR